MFWYQEFGGLVEGYRDTKGQLLAILSHYFTLAKVRNSHLPSSCPRSWTRLLPPDVNLVLLTWPCFGFKNTAGWLGIIATSKGSSRRSHLVTLHSQRVRRWLVADWSTAVPAVGLQRDWFRSKLKSKNSVKLNNRNMAL